MDFVLLQQVPRKHLHCMANEQRRIGLPQRDNLGLVLFQFATISAPSGWRRPIPLLSPETAFSELFNVGSPRNGQLAGTAFHALGRAVPQLMVVAVAFIPVTSQRHGRMVEKL
jgi:hypothetical protein